MVGQLLLVEVDLDFGTVLLAADVDVAGSGHIVTDGVADLLGEGVGLVEAVAVYLHVDCGRGPAHEAGHVALVERSRSFFLLQTTVMDMVLFMVEENMAETPSSSVVPAEVDISLISGTSS